MKDKRTRFRVVRQIDFSPRYKLSRKSRKTQSLWLSKEIWLLTIVHPLAGQTGLRAGHVCNRHCISPSRKVIPRVNQIGTSLKSKVGKSKSKRLLGDTVSSAHKPVLLWRGLKRQPKRPFQQRRKDRLWLCQRTQGPRELYGPTWNKNSGRREVKAIKTHSWLFLILCTQRGGRTWPTSCPL